MSNETQTPPEKRVGRTIRKIKLPRSGLIASVVIMALVAGAYLAWRSPSMLPVADIPVRFFQIATGSTAGTYYPVGEVIATVISEPVGGEPCADEGRCGVPGLLAVVKSSRGSISNVRSVSAGQYDAALAQADIAYWAYSGSGIFSHSEPLANLRAIAGLYPEAVHLVTARDSSVRKVEDLRGMRVSIDRPGSGTRADALAILRAFGLGEDDVDIVEQGPAAAVDLMASGELDAFFLIAGTPAAAVSELIERGIGRLVPIFGPAVEELRRDNRFFVEHEIAADIYPGVARTRTLSVKALLLTSKDQEERLVQDITAALWRAGNRSVLDSGHAKTKEIRLEKALDGVPIPIHPGAARFYRAAGMM
ncbi:MAG: TAXI family TRAP transporter solute-binding subunit [Rhizobiales bacterium]|nr:TAXI family TRAP transporter solute-binding subunit [Hyphomicrobiales bacterium]